MAAELECLNGLCMMLEHHLNALDAAQQPLKTALNLPADPSPPAGKLLAQPPADPCTGCMRICESSVSSSICMDADGGCCVAAPTLRRKNCHELC